MKDLGAFSEVRLTDGLAGTTEQREPLSVLQLSKIFILQKQNRPSNGHAALSLVEINLTLSLIAYRLPCKL